MKKTIDDATRLNAIAYVRENKTWSDAEEAVALENINHYRCSLDDGIANKIMELLAEFAEETLGKDEDWVRENFDADDVFFEL